MTYSKGRGRDDDLSALIRDQLHEPANRQFLSRLPIFQPGADNDDMFADLLARIDRAEAKRARR